MVKSTGAESTIPKIDADIHPTDVMDGRITGIISSLFRNNKETKIRNWKSQNAKNTNRMSTVPPNNYGQR